MDISSAKNPELFSTESRAAAVVVGVTALLLIPTVAVGLRFYTRRVLTGRVSYDDWISLVALNLGFACGITIAYMTRVGLGHHIGTITQSQGISEYLKAFYLSVVFYNIGIMFVKLSFLAMYYRAMKTPAWRKALAFITVLVFAWEVTQVFAAIFFCKPFPSRGDEPVVAAHIKCIPYLPEWYQNTAGNIALNALLLLLSVPMVRRMRLPWAQKLALAAIFSLGIFTLATSIIRIKFLGLYLDTTFDNVDAAMWSVCEISAGLTCACLPTLRPLAARYLPRYFGYQRAGVLMFNRHGKSIPPPLPLHQRPIWYGAESPKLTVDSGVALKSGKMAARSVTTDLDVPFDDYHKPPQYVYAAHSPKAAHPATTMPPQRPTLSRLISSSSSRRHSTPESAADRTEIIVIGLQCVRTGEGPPQERADGGDVVQQPGSVYRGWRNSEADSFSQQMHGPRETTWSTPSTATVPVVFWEDGRNLASPQYHHPEWPVCLQQQDRGFDHIHQNNVAAQFGNEFEGHAATTITRPGDLMMPATSDTPSTTQWYADAGRTEEANLEHIQGNNNRNRNSNRTSNSNNGLRSFWRWRRKNV